MKIAVVYNHVEIPSSKFALPENWYDALDRFSRSYLQFDSGENHDLYICVTGKVTSSQFHKITKELKYNLLKYNGGGWDIGAYIHSARILNSYDFILFLNSQVHFICDDWLYKFVVFYMKNPKSILGAASSFEISPHIRTSCIGGSPSIFTNYPFRVMSRYDACIFEHSPLNFTLWAKNLGYECFVIHQSSTIDLYNSRSHPNGFRNGDQTDMIVNDRHTKIYAETSDIMIKKLLEDNANGLNKYKFHFVPFYLKIFYRISAYLIRYRNDFSYLLDKLKK